MAVSSERLSSSIPDMQLRLCLIGLPTAKIISEEDGKYVISAEVLGDGIDMWLRSQGDNIKIC